MSRNLTGFTPSGRLHLGNLVGAMRPIVEAQDADDPDATLAFVSDLHALTLEHDPALVRDRTLEFATLLLAAGIDPARSLLFVQSHVPEHAELHYLLECATGYGEAHRMIQFKDKSGRQEHVRLSLLTYPVLMAADILLYGTTEVPVGDDQRQHVELARDVAERFNGRYGPTFAVPRVVHPRGNARRLRDLFRPEDKMSKSAPAGSGVLHLLDEPAVLRRTVGRAVTDSLADVAYEPDTRPGVANLLSVLGACTGADPEELADGFTRYGDLKKAVADAVVATVEPLQERYAELAADPGYVQDVLLDGAARASAIAEPTLRAAKEAIGLLPTRLAPRAFAGSEVC
jgi:tryptophanyl-tRNA synthetase